MTKTFNDLAAAARATWSDETTALYEAARSAFSAELSAQTALGAQLAAARTAQHLTQPELSDASGVQQAEISRIERGVANPTAATVARLASALGLRIVLEPTR